MPESQSSVPPSTLILRKQGALDLREVTRRTARRMGRTITYADVDAVLRREAEAGRVRIVDTCSDYRDSTWEAVDA